MEDYFKINRYKINEIKNLDIVQVKKFFITNIEKLYFIFKNDEWKNKTIKNLNKKINSLNTINRIQKFIADCYNHISDRIVYVKKKIVKINNIKTTIYLFT